MEAQRKAIVVQDKAKNKGLQNMRKGMDEYNKLKAEEMKKKAFNAYNHTQTYKNEWLRYHTYNMRIYIDLSLTQDYLFFIILFSIVIILNLENGKLKARRSDNIRISWWSNWSGFE